jgi:alkyl hydroperoxide reductase subunit AhpF
MALLSESNRQQLREVLEQGLTNDVKLVFYTKKDSPLIVPGRECATCKDTGQLLDEISSLSDKIEVDVRDFYEEPERALELKIFRIPAVVMEGSARGQVRFFGIPAGLEFPAFIDDLLDVSRGATSLSQESRESLGTLKKDVHIQVFTTPM